jgi:hypothetical protein
MVRRIFNNAAARRRVYFFTSQRQISEEKKDLSQSKNCLTFGKTSSKILFSSK